MKASVLLLIAVGAGLASWAGAQQRPAYRLPAERAVALPSGPGAALVEGHCAACHSLDYVVTQPRGKGAKFWQDSVAKMRTVYGVELTDTDAAAVSAYLGRTFG